MYCVNCGVKLGDAERVCPLCATTVYHPDIPRKEGVPLYPRDRNPVPPVSSRGAQIIATAAFLLPLLICMTCDLQLSGKISWSGYVAGALITGYVLLVLPGWFHRPNPVIFCGCDFLVIGLYLLYISLYTGGGWFLSFAFPVTGVLGLICTGMLALLRYVRGGALYIFGGALALLGGCIPVMELLLCVTFEPIRFLGWSFYPMTALVLLGGTLIFLRMNRQAREKMEKKFFL